MAAVLVLAPSRSPLAAAFAPAGAPGSAQATVLSMAPPGSSLLKPAATPLLDSGKALARSGELLIDLTRTLDLYGGALSAAGAQIRNAGDCLAQAGASSRFKTGRELVIDEIREAATCLSEATDKTGLAVEEAEADKDGVLRDAVSDLVGPVGICATRLEEAGARIMMRQSLREVGDSLVAAGEGMESMSGCVDALARASNEDADGILSAQRMSFAAEKLKEAGTELRGDTKEKKNDGRAFLKGGF
eukprot:CAMPEP_0201136896 /NCGR_PEP_ID=MMETSP0850-20130426/55126_1 /ASSEMBLY_ACC=CAM_ASM_000622 /TAXON_ID=183588 /ORGANISM="Pseudo-nitzschia fraudulenta, Strain WWA7" /LENGTH=245 /DNA_ID=CAMNT_0047408225 /DNA_START=724 /DNA_END=1461 /DNA_ORIENTATION=-